MEACAGRPPLKRKKSLKDPATTTPVWTSAASPVTSSTVVTVDDTDKEAKLVEVIKPLLWSSSLASIVECSEDKEDAKVGEEKVSVSSSDPVITITNFCTAVENGANISDNEADKIGSNIVAISSLLAENNNVAPTTTNISTTESTDKDNNLEPPSTAVVPQLSKELEVEVCKFPDFKFSTNSEIEFSTTTTANIAQRAQFRRDYQSMKQLVEYDDDPSMPPKKPELIPLEYDYSVLKAMIDPDYALGLTVRKRQLEEAKQEKLVEQEREFFRSSLVHPAQESLSAPAAVEDYYYDCIEGDDFIYSTIDGSSQREASEPEDPSAHAQLYQELLEQLTDYEEEARFYHEQEQRVSAAGGSASSGPITSMNPTSTFENIYAEISTKIRNTWRRLKSLKKRTLEFFKKKRQARLMKKLEAAEKKTAKRRKRSLEALEHMFDGQIPSCHFDGGGVPVAGTSRTMSAEVGSTFSTDHLDDHDGIRVRSLSNDGIGGRSLSTVNSFEGGGFYPRLDAHLLLESATAAPLPLYPNLERVVAEVFSTAAAAPPPQGSGSILQCQHEANGCSGVTLQEKQSPPAAPLPLRRASRFTNSKRYQDFMKTFEDDEEAAAAGEVHLMHEMKESMNLELEDQDCWITKFVYSQFGKFSWNILFDENQNKNPTSFLLYRTRGSHQLRRRCLPRKKKSFSWRSLWNGRNK